MTQSGTHTNCSSHDEILPFDARSAHQDEDEQVSADQSQMLRHSVFFVGFMGAGKTTVARRLARICGITAIDMDAFIERSEDKKVREIFAEGGEAEFRRIETATLKELAQHEPALISCGGGVVLARENREILKEAGLVIYLKVPVTEASSRISDTSSRPLFSDLERAQQICSDRIPLYEEVADVIIDTSGKEVGRIVREVKRALRKEDVL